MSLRTLNRALSTLQLLLAAFGLWAAMQARTLPSQNAKLWSQAAISLSCAMLALASWWLTRRVLLPLRQLHARLDAEDRTPAPPKFSVRELDELSARLGTALEQLHANELEGRRLPGTVARMSDLRLIDDPAVKTRISGAERERIERQLLTVAEREQERLGRELHDGVGQELAGAAFLAKALAARLESANSALTADAEWIKQVLLKCIESVRTLSRQLSPTELERGEVVAALDRLCGDVERAFGIHCGLRVDRNASTLIGEIDANAARQFYRVAQEALNNATRHGACQRIRVRLDLRGRQLRLAIADDGTGMPNALLRREFAQISGLGLQSMRLRASSLCGTIRFSRRHDTTVVLMRVPVAVLTPARFNCQPPLTG